MQHQSSQILVISLLEAVNSKKLRFKTAVSMGLLFVKNKRKGYSTNIIFIVDDPKQNIMLVSIK